MNPNSKPGPRTKLRKFIREHLVPVRLLSDSERFFKSGGNQLLVPKNLPPGTLCIDFGGYLGEWVLSCLRSGNKSKIIVFEPVPMFAARIAESTANIPDISDIPDIQIIPHALGKYDSEVFISLDGAASSLHIYTSNNPDNRSIKIRTRPYDYLKDLVGSSRINWVKINIEGAEYELLDFLVDSNLIQKIDTLVVQFHKLDGRSLESAHNILNKTHVKIWGYEYVWERWDLRVN